MASVDPFVIYLATAVVIFVAIVVVTLLNALRSGKVNNQENGGQQAQASARVAEIPPRAQRRVARHRMIIRHGESEESSGEDDDVNSQQHDGKIGTKKMRKLQEKAERKAIREEMERERQEKKVREQEAEEQRKKHEELKRQEQAIREEEERKSLLEKEHREHEEYLKLREAFTVDAEGEDEAEADLGSESLLYEFISYIKAVKVVMLEDLAAHFKLKTQDVIQRVQDLQANGDLTGVIDDRGKFIYITMEELEAVAKYVKQHGRVSKADLAVSSNRLITLNTCRNTAMTSTQL